MKYAAVLLLALLVSCTAVPQPRTPTALVTVAVTVLPTVPPTVSIVPTVRATDVPPTPAPGGYRMRTVRAIPVGEVDVTEWLCHDENYWWDVTESGMILHEDAVGERLCRGMKTL